MKTLIVYATKYGCTRKAAIELSKYLDKEVKLVNAMEDQVEHIDEYDTVIIGGSIYMGKIQKQITSFVNNNLELLLTKKIGLFICAGSPEDGAREKELVDSFPDSLFKHATCKELFGYEIDYKKMKLFDRLIMRAVSKSKESSFKLDYDTIKQFGNTLKGS